MNVCSFIDRLNTGFSSSINAWQGQKIPSSISINEKGFACNEKDKPGRRCRPVGRGSCYHPCSTTEAKS